MFQSRLFRIHRFSTPSLKHSLLIQQSQTDCFRIGSGLSKFINIISLHLIVGANCGGNMSPYPKSKFLALILCLLAAPLSLSAQSTSGSIAGTVQDKNGAAISSARVVVTDQSRQVSLTTTTDGEGRFAFAQLQPGRYDVKVD